MVRKLLFVAALLFVAGGVYCQKSSLSGQVKDKGSGEPIPFANVVVMYGETALGGTATDFKGKFVIKNLEPGIVTVKSSAVGYKALEIERLILKADQMRFLDVEMESKVTRAGEVQIVAYKVPLIDKENTMATYPVTAEDIEKMPGRTVLSVANAVAGIASSMQGELNLCGKVLDQRTGKPIPFADIKLYYDDVQFASAKADEKGRYSIKGIKGGNFSILGLAMGYKTKTIKGVTVSARGKNELNVQLK